MIKRSIEGLLINEQRGLERFRNCSAIRPMVDIVEEPKSLILQYLDDHLLDVSRKKRLEGSDLKFVARRILEALAVIHDAGYVHTGIFIGRSQTF